MSLTAGPPGREIRLLHWNVHSWQDPEGGSNGAAVSALTTSTRADVVSLVEVDEIRGAPSTLNKVAQDTATASVFVPSFAFGDRASVRGLFGNALLTRLPITAVRHHQLLWPTAVYDGTEPSEPRSLLLIHVHTGIGPLWIGSTHLPRADARARAAAWEHVVEQADSLDHPWIVLGDFNEPATSWLTHQLSPRPRVVVAPDPPVATYPADEPFEAIDFAVASPGLTLSATVLDVAGSDHRPLLVILSL